MHIKQLMKIFFRGVATHMWMMMITPKNFGLVVLSSSHMFSGQYFAIFYNYKLSLRMRNCFVSTYPTEDSVAGKARLVPTSSVDRGLHGKTGYRPDRYETYWR